MILWAVFSLGYLFGVFITLKFFVGKEEFETTPDVTNAVVSDKIESSDVWENFTRLTTVNYRTKENASKDRSDFIPSLSV